jgi:hypothetical protein
LIPTGQKNHFQKYTSQWVKNPSGEKYLISN